ncbi:DUF341 domain protein [Tricladium varicosporioides]|nr:DUF341 domain protein [Hymenoscyphus varicosporioides]
MHFLCLHGIGTNSHVLETQTASLRHEMDTHHTYHFVEGTQSCPVATGTDGILLAISQLSNYIIEEGPFDGVIAFSQGAALVSTYLMQFGDKNPGIAMPFRCAIFLSGSRPYHAKALLERKVEHIELENGGAFLNLPTTHIWGRQDTLKSQSEALWNLSDEKQRDGYIHSGGHEIPGARAQEDLQRCIKAIRRTIDRASLEC